MLVRDAMTRKVHTIRSDKKLAAARSIMDWASVSHLPVVDVAGHLVGLITRETLNAAEPSVLDASVPRAESDRRLATTPVSNALVPDLPAVTPETGAASAAAIMEELGVSCLPVLDGSRLAGIVSRDNLRGLIEGRAA